MTIRSGGLRRGVAQPGRAPGSGPGGRRFKSSLPDHLFLSTISFLRQISLFPHAGSGRLSVRAWARWGSEVQILSPRPFIPFNNFLFTPNFPVPSRWFGTFIRARLGALGVGGSNPLSPTIYSFQQFPFYAKFPCSLTLVRDVYPCALGRAGGRRFKSSLPRPILSLHATPARSAPPC